MCQPLTTTVKKTGTKNQWENESTGNPLTQAVHTGGRALTRSYNAKTKEGTQVQTQSVTRCRVKWTNWGLRHHALPLMGVSPISHSQETGHTGKRPALCDTPGTHIRSGVVGRKGHEILVNSIVLECWERPLKVNSTELENAFMTASYHWCSTNGVCPQL